MLPSIKLSTYTHLILNTPAHRGQEVPHHAEDGEVAVGWWCVWSEAKHFDLPACLIQHIEIRLVPVPKVACLVVDVAGRQLRVQEAVQDVRLLLCQQLAAEGHHAASTDVGLLLVVGSHVKLCGLRAVSWP